LDCERVQRDELIERYLAGVLDEAEREAFEEHFFECDRCLEELDTMRAAQQLLSEAAADLPTEHRPPRSRKLWVFASGIAAALAVIGVSVTLLTPKPELPAELLELAAIEAPSYTPIRLRGAADEAQQRFRTAMEFYSTGDYVSAIPGLEEAAELDPNAPNISFFLGASYLLTDRISEGIATLQHTVDLGDTPYLEEALLLLAQAHLGAGDIDKARDELGRVLELEGDFSEQARTMLELLDGGKETRG
jgi:tetratricopeptide (TPR) repeat protein